MKVSSGQTEKFPIESTNLEIQYVILLLILFLFSTLVPQLSTAPRLQKQELEENQK